MFSNTGYEAMYSYLGLVFHEKSIEIITSQKVFLGIILIIFGFSFFITSVQFFSRYIPGALVHRRSVPLSKYVQIVFFLFIGMAFLRVGATTNVSRFNGESWHDNPYIKAKLKDVQAEHKVSFIFDILSRTAEEVAALISRVVDQLFESSHSQLDAPNFFFKAIMYGGLSTIEDPKLKEAIKFYTDECFDRVIPFIKDADKKAGFLDKLFRNQFSDIDKNLAAVTLETADKHPYTCLDVKNEVRDGLKSYSLEKGKEVYGDKIANILKIGPKFYPSTWENLEASGFLVNYYLEQHEGPMGIQKGSQLPTTGGKIAQYINRFFSPDGIMGIFSSSKQGVWMAASRSQEFSENLARAPHVAGFIKMIAIGIFPWLLFFVIAGHYRVIFYWFTIYFSVLLWTPIWTLLYHIMVNISLSSEVMTAFGKLNDGISLYSAELITSRMYYLYAVYSWLQILTGTLFTALVLYFLRPAMADTEKSSAPEFVDSASKVAGTVGTVGAVTGLL